MASDECKTCGGSGHVNHQVCQTCEGYGLIDENGVKRMTMDRLHRALARFAAEQGWPFGMPVPSIGPSQRRVVIAKGAPFADREVPIQSMPEMMGHVTPRELRGESSPKIVNCWHN